MGRADYDRADRGRYEAYIASPAWARRRRRSLALSGRRCQYEREDDFGAVTRCPRTRYLTVHHRTYDRLGHEIDEDLEVLCYFHHMVEHLMWRECGRCKTPVLGSYARAEAWLADAFRAAGIDLDAGPVAWDKLPTKSVLEGMVPPECEKCAFASGDF